MEQTGKQTKARPPRRWLLLRFADLLARLFAAPARRDTVLLVRTFGIGDALLFRLLLDAYKAALVPVGMRCVILGATDWQPIIADFFAGETVILVDQKRYARRFFYRLRFNIMLRRLGVARAVCPVYRRNPIVADAMVAATDAPERWVMQPEVAPKMQAVAEFFRSGMTRIIDTDAVIAPGARHELQRQLDFIARLVPGAPSDLPRTRLDDLLPDLPAGESDNAVLINLGASYGPRRWPLARWLQVAAALAADGRRVVLVGGPAERDLLSDVEIWVASLPPALRGQIEVSIAAWSFAELIRRTRHAALVLSSDTGPAHLAALLGVAVIVALGGGHFGEFFPYPQQPAWAHIHVLWHKRDCYFCSWACPYLSAEIRTYPCISDIAIDEMVAAARQALETAGLKPPVRVTG
jgi:ADP-heptose:LPS heptosyltransferase